MHSADKRIRFWVDATVRKIKIEGENIATVAREVRPWMGRCDGGEKIATVWKRFRLRREDCDRRHR